MNYDRERSRLLRELADLDQREREEREQEAVYFDRKAQELGLNTDDGPPAACSNIRVVYDIYSLGVTLTIIARSGFRLTSQQPL